MCVRARHGFEKSVEFFMVTVSAFTISVNVEFFVNNVVLVKIDDLQGINRYGANEVLTTLKIYLWEESEGGTRWWWEWVGDWWDLDSFSCSR